MTKCAEVINNITIRHDRFYGKFGGYVVKLCKPAVDISENLMKIKTALADKIKL